MVVPLHLSSLYRSLGVIGSFRIIRVIWISRAIMAITNCERATSNLARAWYNCQHIKMRGDVWQV